MINLPLYEAATSSLCTAGTQFPPPNTTKSPNKKLKRGLWLMQLNLPEFLTTIYNSDMASVTLQM